MIRCALVPRSHHAFLSPSNRNWRSNVPLSGFFHGNCHSLVSLVGKHTLGQGFAVSDAAGGATGWTRQLLLHPRNLATMAHSPAVFHGTSHSFSSSSPQRPRKNSRPRLRSPRRSSSKYGSHSNDEEEEKDDGTKLHNHHHRSRKKRRSPGNGEHNGTAEPWDGQNNHNSSKLQINAVEQARAKKLADHAAALERIECLAAIWTRPTTPASQHPMVQEVWSRMTERSLSTQPTPTQKE